MTSQTAPTREPHSRLEHLINWLALAALVALGCCAAPAHAYTPEPESGARLLKDSAAAAPIEALRVGVQMHATVTGNIARVGTASR